MFNQINQLHNVVLSSSTTVSLGESRNTGFADVCLDDGDNLATSGNEKDSSLGSLMVSGVVTSCRDTFLSF